MSDIMKKIAVFVDNPIRSPYKNDQYDSFRAEGRISINIGFGLSLLGFEVNIIMGEWNTDKNKQLYENVYLSNIPKYDKYDYILTFSMNSLNIVKYDKAVFLDYIFAHVNDIYKYINDTKKDIIYVNIAERMNKYTEKGGHKFPIKYYYLPALYPIPSINIGFLPYNFEIVNNELKIFVFYNTDKASEHYKLKEKLIIDFFKDKGYKIKLYVHTGSKKTLINCPFKEYNIEYLYDTDARYIDVINTIKSSDICVIPGTHCSGNNMVDIISLGKPLLYISDIIINPEHDIHCNHIYETPEYLIYTQENDNESIEKLEKFILNPKESYDIFKETHKCYNFDNWKEYAKKIFIP